ncbi:cation:proton antiporter [Metallosphaera hakonensis]|uniref:Cation:proton antiporter n=1 Tax=Metallosphaera hakonensis JCM 8857 = DSM 7519 TaxID=1293036 RepID=A0A2U9IVQ8_9CREN|nr:cation:proton antiporter [Metallosphaera hakonensis]AWS00161.1 cation:proton antiporter [Metallosphaera hakonensis JCM 8857 = DSM 7519]
MSSDDIYLALLEIFVLITAAQGLKVTSRKARIPPLIMELLTGLILSPFALGSVINSITGYQIFTINSYLILFSEFSVILLIFASGLEHGFKSLRTSGGLASMAATAGAVLPFVGVFFYMSRFVSFDVAILMGAATGATSLAAVASIIEGEKLENERYVKITLSAAAIDDVVAFIILSISLALIDTRGLTFFDVFKLTLTVVISWLIIFFASVFIIPRIISIVSDSLVVDVSLLILFILVTIMITLGFSPIIAAFIAGVAIAESRKAERIRGMVRTMIGIFGSIFFISIGAQTDIFTFMSPNVLIQGSIITVLAIVLKFVGIYPFAYLYNKDPKRALASSLGMIPRGEMGLVISSIAFSSGIFDQADLSEIILMSLATTVIGAVAFERSARNIMKTQAT